MRNTKDRAKDEKIYKDHTRGESLEYKKSRVGDDSKTIGMRFKKKEPSETQDEKDNAQSPPQTHGTKFNIRERNSIVSKLNVIEIQGNAKQQPTQLKLEKKSSKDIIQRIKVRPFADVSDAHEREEREKISNQKETAQGKPRTTSSHNNWAPRFINKLLQANN